MSRYGTDAQESLLCAMGANRYGPLGFKAETCKIAQQHTIKEMSEKCTELRRKLFDAKAEIDPRSEKTVCWMKANNASSNRPRKKLYSPSNGGLS
ncbi:MAG: hypothetical protein M2R45_03597 [Verrucomicrobia subdivision 3 bacterium]|nr:hypothetical protein [Limisphaerales bacterium]MCS1414771.1 hypothetical protein [Limisphaerales bacterium]